jgi:hypothetical protein
MRLTGYQIPAAIRGLGEARLIALAVCPQRQWRNCRFSRCQRGQHPGHRAASGASTQDIALPSMGPELAAEFVAATGSDMDAFGSAGHRVGNASMAHRPSGSGRMSRNLRRPRRHLPGLLRATCLSAMVDPRCCPTSKAYYDRKRTMGKGHKQALAALARHRINILWATFRNGAYFHTSPPITITA